MMPISKKYLHDKLILLLASGNIFLAFLAIALIFLRLNISQSSASYIVQYRPSLGISRFTNGGVSDILAFALFALVVLTINIALSIRTYSIRRELSLAVLVTGIFLLMLAIIVSNALMVLH